MSYVDIWQQQLIAIHMLVIVYACRFESLNIYGHEIVM